MLRIHRNYEERASTERVADGSCYVTLTLVEMASSNSMCQLLCNVNDNVVTIRPYGSISESMTVRSLLCLCVCVLQCVSAEHKSSAVFWFPRATMSERKAVIKNADMSEDMQQDAVECATQALEKYNIEKDIAAYIKKVNVSPHLVIPVA